MRISYGKLRVPVHRIDGDDVLACEVSVEVLGDNFLPAYTAVSYTHLTLPTNREV